jgi:hypothetical protein
MPCIMFAKFVFLVCRWFLTNFLADLVVLAL